MILAVKITKLDPHSGYYFEPGEKLNTAKPITNLEAPDIVKKKILKKREFKKKPTHSLFITLCYYHGANKMSNSVNVFSSVNCELFKIKNQTGKRKAIKLQRRLNMN